MARIHEIFSGSGCGLIGVYIMTLNTNMVVTSPLVPAVSFTDFTVATSGCYVEKAGMSAHTLLYTLHR